MPAEITAQVVGTYELPGEAVFPESIGVDPATGDAADPAAWWRLVAVS